MSTVSLAARPQAQRPQRVSAVVELRQYTLHPGRREALIELFEREFVQPQEACGMDLIGQFRDLDAPDRFVWLRGFSDMRTRAQALTAFYGGPVWKAHRAAANATMIDSDDVLLLRPSRPVGGFALAPRVALDEDENEDPGVVLAHLHPLHADDPTEFLASFEHDLLPLLWNAGLGVCASLVTETATNTFPALPVREGESMFVWFSRHASLARATEAQARLDEALDWAPQVADALAARQRGATQVLRLQATAQSRLRG
jgi:hypothetical protein